MSDDMLVFNGVDADSGDYLTPPASLAGLAGRLRGERRGGGHLDELRRRHHDDEEHLGVIYPRDPNKLESAAWGLVVPEDLDPAILDAVEPLVRLRREQAGDLYRKLVVRPGEEKDDFLRRYGMGPSVADPRKVPYYLLIVGSPEQIPFGFQYQLDVSYAVGRIDFDSPAEYAAYAAAVVAAEAPETAAERRVHFFAPRNPADTPTALSASRLAQPLADELREMASGWRVTGDVGAAATRTRLADLLTAGGAPQVLFTASHGLAAAGDRQREIAGALLCQDWPGPLAGGGAISADHYLAGRDIPTDRAVRPRVLFSFACFGAGTPSVSDFSDTPTGARPGLAERSFVARLPQRLLANPAGGALAFVGHVDRAWSCSFLWKGIDPQVTPFTSTMLALLDGVRLGCAMESVNAKYAELATELTRRLDEARRYGKRLDDAALVALWTAHNDARSYVVLGDPAIRLAQPGGNDGR